MAKLLTLVKLGGSVITDKSSAFTFRRKVTGQIARDLKHALETYRGDLIIGHGSGSFGHVVAKRYKTQQGIINSRSKLGLTKVSVAAYKLNRLVLEELVGKGLLVVSLSPGSFILSHDHKTKSVYVDPLKAVLAQELIPLVYGDVVFDTKRGFGIYSTEKVLLTIASKLHKDYQKLRMIHLTDVDGIYDSKGKVVPLITESNFEQVAKSLEKPKVDDVTGGMAHKVKQSLEFAKRYNVEVIIANGMKKGMISDAILGKRIKATIIKF